MDAPEHGGRNRAQGIPPAPLHNPICVAALAGALDRAIAPKTGLTRRPAPRFNRGMIAMHRFRALPPRFLHGFSGRFLLAPLLCAGTLAPAVAADPVPQELREAVERLEQRGGAGVLLRSVDAESFRDLAYVENGHERQTLDLHVPGGKRAGRMPTVVFIHGGGWRNGRKSTSTALPLIVRGYAVAGIGYRLSDAAQFPAQIHDCKAAIRWLRANADRYGLDPDRIGVWGQSAGAHLAALLGTAGDVAELEGDLGERGVSSRVQAVCDAYGPADFLLGDIGGRSDNPSGPVALLLGGPPMERRELARRASPVHWISPDDAPTLILQGGLDRTVPPVQSRTLAERLRAAGVETELLEFPEASHGGPEFKSPETLAKIAAFFDKHLKGGL